MAQAVSEVMTRNQVTLPGRATLTDAARKMRDADIGDVLVMDGGTLRGIVTDRDITIRAVADGRDPNQVTLDSICSSELVTVPADQSVDKAADMMRKKAVRRVPVVEGGRRVGIVSLGDLAVDRDSGSGLADISASEPNK